MAIRGAFEAMPADVARPLRQFQVHQRRDGTLHLRIVSVEPLSPALLDRLHTAWRAVAGHDAPELEITQVPEIPRDHGRKFQDFTSDFMGGPDMAAHPV